MSGSLNPPAIPLLTPGLSRQKSSRIRKTRLQERPLEAAVSKLPRKEWTPLIAYHRPAVQTITPATLAISQRAELSFSGRQKPAGFPSCSLVDPLTS
ncbi:hypothetical protein PoB_007030200 [Plakobranchus ocellatus]|uniref:Uncharacterized protein n=1 Tax=Plakobranchus ocellatus TaxID=259542 RepID=A0AAV4DHR3_9GAST|nr:hypothetical protein PoB_007030200 [Plakobranchus ocellatus]